MNDNDTFFNLFIILISIIIKKVLTIINNLLFVNYIKIKMRNYTSRAFLFLIYIF